MAGHGLFTVEQATDFDVTNLSTVINHIKPLESKWHTLGIQLKIKKDTLDCIEADHKQNGVQRCLSEMISHWQKNEDDPSWTKLADAVKRVGGYNDVVKSIRRCIHKSNSSSFKDELESGYASMLPLDSEVDLDLFSKSSLSPGCGCGECNVHKMCTEGCPEPDYTKRLPILTKYIGGVTASESASERLSPPTSQSQQNSVEMFEMETSDLRANFGRLVLKTSKSLKQREEKDDVALYLLNTFPMLRKIASEIEQAAHMSQLFTVVTCQACSWFNFDIIKRLIEEFGCAEDHNNLEAYEQHFERFAKRRLPQEMGHIELGSMHGMNGCKKLVIKVDREWESVTIGELERLCREFAKFLGVERKNVYLTDVNEGCFMLTMVILEETANSLSNNGLSSTQKQMLENERVVRLTCGKMKWFTTSQQFFSDSEESEQEMISSDESDMKQTSIRFQPNQDVMLKSELQEAQQYCNMLKDQVERLRNVAYAAGHKQLVKVACDLKSDSEQMNKKLMHASELLTDDKQTEKSLSPSSSVSSTSSSVSNTSCSSDITPPKHEVQAVSKQLKPHILPNSTYQMFEFPSERKKPSSITSIKRPRASTMVVSGPPPSREQTRIPVKQFTSTKPIPPPKPRMVTSITLKDVSKQVKSHRLSLPGTTVSTEKHSSTHQASKLTVATSNSQPSTLRTARFPIKYKPPPPPKPVWSSVCVPLKKFSDSHNRDNQFTRALAVGPNEDDDYYEVSFNGKGYAFFGEASQIKKTEKPTQFPAMPLPVIHIVEVSGTTQASHKGPPPPTKPKPNSKLLASHSIKPETAAYSTPGSGDSGICVTHSLPAHIVGVSGDLLQDHGPRYVNIPAHGNEHVYESIDDLENNYK